MMKMKRTIQQTIKMKKNNLLIVLFTFISFSLFSQENELYKASITNDDTKGFKVVTLTPNIRAIANTNLSDIRILDTNQKQIPYFLQEKTYKEQVTFIPLKNQLFFKKKSTEAIITNSAKKSLHNIILRVSNADVLKSCKIEGSEHLKQWFVISENIQFSLNNNSTKAYNYYNIQFPKIDYPYIKLTINDSLSAPINIKDIGYFNRKVIQKEDSYKALDFNYTISQKDKKTIIHVSANRAFEINRVAFEIKAPKLYNRNVQFYTVYQKNKKEYKQRIHSLVLNSDNETIFNNLHSNQKDFFIAIDNKDNQPLEIGEIRFAQKEKFLVSDLKPNQTYQILAGDKKLKKPSYDLVNFKNTIDTNIPVIAIQNEQFYFLKTNKTKSEKAFYEQAWFMWISIALVAALILFFTLSLIKQTKKM